jgi:hypothetical protein
MRLFAFLVALFLVLSGSAAHAAPPAPVAGNYPCYTFQISQQLHERMRRSVATLEDEWKMVFEQRTDVYPAGITIQLDGRGNYKVLGTRAVGRYSYNAQTGKIIFSGEASELGLRHYTVRNGIYIMIFMPNADVSYQCEFSSGNRSVGATGGSTTAGSGSGGGTQPGFTLPRRSTRPITAQDLTGRFEGKYVCSGQDTTRLILDMQADPNGKLRAKFTFGGTNNVPNGSYTLQGRWSSEGFFLSADRWIQQPEGYAMANMDGYRGANGELAGEILFQGCSGYIVSRR